MFCSALYISFHLTALRLVCGHSLRNLNSSPICPWLVPRVTTMPSATLRWMRRAEISERGMSSRTPTTTTMMAMILISIKSATTRASRLVQPDHTHRRRLLHRNLRASVNEERTGMPSHGGSFTELLFRLLSQSTQLNSTRHTSGPIQHINISS